MVEVARAASGCHCHFFPINFRGYGRRAEDCSSLRWPRGKQGTIGRKKEQSHAYAQIHHLVATSRRLQLTAALSSSNKNYRDSDNIKKPEGTVTFSSSIATDIPIYEPLGVSFDEYIYDRPRVFRAMFPDERRSKRLNNEEWRIQMLPIQFFLATVYPVVDMRLVYKSNANEYPPVVPKHATGILELKATKWQLNGLQGLQIPPHFMLGVQGVLYADRSSNHSRLKGNMKMSISMILPPMLKFVPEDVLRGVADMVLGRLVQKMKEEVNTGLISDYQNFRKEKMLKQTMPVQPPATSA